MSIDFSNCFKNIGENSLKCVFPVGQKQNFFQNTRENWLECMFSVK